MVQILKPHPALEPFVLFYAVTRGFFATSENHVMSARGLPMLIFPYKSPSSTSYRYGLEGGNVYPRQMLDKPALLTSTDMFSQSHFAGDIHFVMVMLQMTGGYHFLRSGVNGLSSQVNLLDNYGMPSYFDELQERLWEVEEPQAAVAMIEPYLIRHFCRQKALKINDLTPVSDYMMRMPPGNLTVKDLTKKFRCSDRWLERNFAQQTGMAPKTWLRVLRFRAAVSYLEYYPGCSWMEIVVRFGYANHSHLINDFQQFAGSSPVFHVANYGRSEAMVGFNRSDLYANHHHAA
ncbi:MAG: AraC family transcriptional regulator [Bacteroidia bacterium]|nr:AraC family transcriptional regulator [Bacteroidia bacterium]